MESLLRKMHDPAGLPDLDLDQSEGTTLHERPVIQLQLVMHLTETSPQYTIYR